MKAKKPFSAEKALGKITDKEVEFYNRFIRGKPIEYEIAQAIRKATLQENEKENKHAWDMGYAMGELNGRKATLKEVREKMRTLNTEQEEDVRFAYIDVLNWLNSKLKEVGKCVKRSVV